MDQSPRRTFSGLVALVALFLIFPRLSLAKSVAYCSNENTSDFEKQHWPWQSQGWCNDACKSDHPYGIIQGEYCWCSDYAPADTVSNSDCSDSCPGYPDEKCGNLNDNLFIYIRLDSTAKVKGTKGGTQPTSSSNSPASTPGTTAIPNDSIPPPMTSMQVVTVSGVVVTKTIITGPTNVPPVTQPSKKTSTSAIVGGVVGGVAVLCAVAGAVLFTLWRRRRQQYQEDGGQSGVQRNASTMSKMPFGSGSGPQYPPTIATNFNGRNSRILDTDSISPISVSDRRSSRLVFDQRLNPSAIMVLDNPSRESFASMDDSRDYGRTLNVRNPDPHP